tara:strand:- start:53 stop:784 length:732 start_codon:yes stop_codon:yes gene_type:complete
MNSYIKNGDMRNEISLIKDNSIQLITADLPYGHTEMIWDNRLDMKELWPDWWRVLKDNGSIILFGSQPFTSYLVSSQEKFFKYSLVWQKSRVAGWAQAPYRILNEHEDILIFSKAGLTKNSKNRILYNPQGVKVLNKEVTGKGSNPLRNGRKKQENYIQKFTNYPKSILNFRSEGIPIHPTQKPLLLYEYLVKSFSNENDFVLDPCFGSGNSIIAAINTKRNYVGFEIDINYFKQTGERVKNA